MLLFGKLSFCFVVGFICCGPICWNPLPAPGEASAQASSSVCPDTGQKTGEEGKMRLNCCHKSHTKYDRMESNSLLRFTPD